MLAAAQGVPVGITGLGVHVPERIVTNEEMATIVDTSDEWIRERTGIRERRFAADDEALTDIALPAARAALEDAGVEAADIDFLVCATVTPDMMFPTSSALLADALGAPRAAAYDLLAGCTGFVYAIAQAYAMLASGLSRKALVVGGDVLSKILDWEDRSTLVLFGDGAGAVVMETVDRGGFLGFELGADGGGGEYLWYPGSGSRHFDDAGSFVKMNGREVFRFATRVMVSSATAILDECGKTVDEVDVYVPHQANKRIIDYAAAKLGIPPEKTIVNVDRYGNTSSGSIPLALADARAEGRLPDGTLVLIDYTPDEVPALGGSFDNVQSGPETNFGTATTYVFSQSERLPECNGRPCVDIFINDGSGGGWAVLGGGPSLAVAQAIAEHVAQSIRYG